MRTARPVIVCWGELVWDVFGGESGALGPRKVLGGSATALAVQLATLGAEARLVSAIGEDQDGERALEQLTHRGVKVSAVLRARSSPTAAVQVHVEAGGEPSYCAQQRLNWAKLDFEPALTEAATQADALVFSAFAQGTCLDLGPLERVFERARPRLVGCDLNLRGASSGEHLGRVASTADFVKLNQLEYERAARALSGEEPAAWLLRSGRTQLVAVTAGAAGARLLTRTDPVRGFAQSGNTPARLVDAVGAGDAFTAALTLALLADLPPAEALARAIAHAESQLALRGAMPARSGSGDESV